MTWILEMFAVETIVNNAIQNMLQLVLLKRAFISIFEFIFMIYKNDIMSILKNIWSYIFNQISFVDYTNNLTCGKISFWITEPVVSCINLFAF
jgi:hypothetical protein